MNKPKQKCDVCGGFCGGSKQDGCKFAANDAKRRADGLWKTAVASLPKNQSGS